MDDQIKEITTAFAAKITEDIKREEKCVREYDTLVYSLKISVEVAKGEKTNLSGSVKKFILTRGGKMEREFKQ